MVCPPPQPEGQKEQEPQGLKPTETPRALPDCSSLRGPTAENLFRVVQEARSGEPHPQCFFPFWKSVELCTNPFSPPAPAHKQRKGAVLPLTVRVCVRA